jgi:hypothetical protein
MKAYQINIAPRLVWYGICDCWRKQNHALAEFSKSLRSSIKIINAKIACGPECNISIHEKERERVEHLENQVEQRSNFYS